MAATFKIGDIVQLHSGGPKMTVDEISQYGDKEKVHCVWFAGSKREGAYFNINTLVNAPKESPKK